MVDNNILGCDLNFILEHTRNLWEELRGERIFITGGTGFFGCWLLESFAWANQRLNLKSEALVLTRDFTRFKNKASHLANNAAIKFHFGDTRDFIFPKGIFSHVIHAATEASVKLSLENPQLMLDTITTGTQRIIDFSAQSGVKKILFTSSGAVYGRQPSNLALIPDDYERAHYNEEEKASYSAGKILAEDLLIAATKKFLFQVKIARCFAFVGPYLPLDAHFAIGNFILAGLCGEDINIKGDGTPYRSYLYAADLMIWLWTILFRGENCLAYNVGSEEAISIAELAHKVAEHFSPRPKISIAKTAQADVLAERYVPATKRAQDGLGLKQLIDLDAAIEKTKSWNMQLNITRKQK